MPQMLILTPLLASGGLQVICLDLLSTQIPLAARALRTSMLSSRRLAPLPGLVEATLPLRNLQLATHLRILSKSLIAKICQVGPTVRKTILRQRRRHVALLLRVQRASFQMIGIKERGLELSRRNQEDRRVEHRAKGAVVLRERQHQAMLPSALDPTELLDTSQA